MNSKKPDASVKWDLTIEAGKTERHYWHDIWNYRELFWFLAWRDILVRYKQTVFGVAWAVVRPVLTMVVFSVIFGRVAKLPSDGIPYPIMVYAAMLPWQFFSTSFAEASNSLVSSANLISKVYFPRMIIPLGKTVVSLVDFGIAALIYLILMIYYGMPFTIRLLALPAFLFLALVTAIGPGLLIASLNVRYRDFRHLVPFMVRLGLYISPVGFLSSVVPDKWRFLYSINPMVGVIDGFRWCLLGTAEFYIPGFVLSIGFAIVFLFIGVVYFRSTERTFADII
jgi:lipopolysaccharide transport system permease protein